MTSSTIEAVEELPHPTSGRLPLLPGGPTGMTSKALARVDAESSEADLVDQVALLERLRGAALAAQAATVERLGRVWVERGLAEDVGVTSAAVWRRRSAWPATCRRPSPPVAARRLGSAGA